jgi:hypothetical protein
MATLVSDIIQSSMRLLGATTHGRTASTPALSDGLTALNLMLDAWNADRLFIYAIAANTYSLTAGQQTYTMGSGGNFNTTRPAAGVESANIVLSNNGQTLRVPMELIDQDRWADIRLQGVGSGIPQLLYVDGAYPLANLSFWPYPNATCSVELYTWQALTQFTAVTDTVSLPPGYAEALKYNLAVRLGPEFGVPEIPPSLVALAAESKAAIQSLNTPAPIMDCDPAIASIGGAGRSSFNWLTGNLY